VQRQDSLTNLGLLTGSDANQANDSSMSVAADYCELAEVLIECDEYPAFGIRSGE
jgi:hypothetical protein